MLLGCLNAKFGPQKDVQSGKFGGKFVMNENNGFGGGVMTTIISKHQLRVRNSP